MNTGWPNNLRNSSHINADQDCIWALRGLVKINLAYYAASLTFYTGEKGRISMPATHVFNFHGAQLHAYKQSLFLYVNSKNTRSSLIHMWHDSTSRICVQLSYVTWHSVLNDSIWLTSRTLLIIDYIEK